MLPASPSLPGTDMDMMSYAYALHLAELVADGSVPETVVDEAVLRILQHQFPRLGLFDQPCTDETLPDRIILRPDFQDLALRAAQESMVLLKNDASILPLSPNTQRIASIGPLADNKADLLGCWTAFGQKDEVETILEAITSSVEFPSSSSTYPAAPLSATAPQHPPNHRSRPVRRYDYRSPRRKRRHERRGPFPCSPRPAWSPAGVAGRSCRHRQAHRRCAPTGRPLIIPRRARSGRCPPGRVAQRRVHRSRPG